MSISLIGFPSHYTRLAVAKRIHLRSEVLSQQKSYPSSDIGLPLPSTTQPYTPKRPASLLEWALYSQIMKWLEAQSRRKKENPSRGDEILSGFIIGFSSLPYHPPQFSLGDKILSDRYHGIPYCNCSLGHISPGWCVLGEGDVGMAGGVVNIRCCSLGYMEKG